MASFEQSLNDRFPGARSEVDFIEESYKAMAEHGFDAENTIACVGVCRDELCRTLVWSVRDVWGEAFNFSGLGGMLTLGWAFAFGGPSLPVDLTDVAPAPDYANSENWTGLPTQEGLEDLVAFGKITRSTITFD